MKADPICQDLQSLFNKALVSDIQETNRVVRLAKAHMDLALPVCKIRLDLICLVSYGDASGGNTRAERAQAGYVIMFADRALLEGMAASVTLVSWRSHRVKRVVISASAAEAMGLSEAIAQGDWVRALWSEVVLGLNLREWREQEKMCHTSFRSPIQRAITIIYTTSQPAPVRTEGLLLIWQSSEKTRPDHRCSCGGLMERRKWPTP